MHNNTLTRKVQTVKRMIQSSNSKENEQWKPDFHACSPTPCPPVHLPEYSKHIQICSCVCNIVYSSMRFCWKSLKGHDHRFTNYPRGQLETLSPSRPWNVPSPIVPELGICYWDQWNCLYHDWTQLRSHKLLEFWRWMLRFTLFRLSKSILF